MARLLVALGKVLAYIAVMLDGSLVLSRLST
jgi:hypothetical protein